MTLQVVLGEYKDNQVKILILSNKYLGYVNFYKNGKIINNITIKDYEINFYILDDIQLNQDYYFELEYLDKIIDTFKINLKDSLFSEVVIVNCDSGYGLETGTWDLIADDGTKYIFHLGDQIYNDKYFMKFYNQYKNKVINQIDKDQIYKTCYNYFLEHFTRNNKTNILKNNFNFMIPDDHEVMDNQFVNRIPKNQLFNSEIIFNIINELSNSIETGLKFESNEINYLEDKENSTLYILNYSLEFNDEFYKKNDYLEKIAKFNNIIFLCRKCKNSVRYNKLATVIYNEPEYNSVDIDFLLNLGIENKYKKIIVLCGDEHIKSTGEYYLNDKNILTIKTVGSINSAVDLLNYETILKSKINNIKLKTNKQVDNGFVKITYKNSNINVQDIINHKSYFYHIKNSMLSGSRLLYYKIKK